MITPADFDEQPAPDGMRFWRLRDLPESTLFHEPIPVTVLLQHTDLTGADLALLTAIVADVDRYLVAALDFVRQRLAEDPAFFGVTKPPAAVPLVDPEVTVIDDAWLIRFADGLPLCDPYGVVVNFAGDLPVSVEDLSEYEQLE